MTRGLSPAVVALCWIAGAVAPALAQAPVADRPSGGVFGARAEARGSNQSLDLTATLVQAYDDNLIAESGLVSPTSGSLGGHFTMLQAGSQYRWGNKTVQLGLTGASAFRYYNQVGDIQTVSHSGAVGLSASLARRTNLLVNQSAAYAPSYMFGLFPQLEQPAPGATQPAAPDYGLTDLASYSYVTTSTLSHGLTGRTSISASADYSLTDFVREENGRRDVKAYGVRAELSRNVGRRSSLQTRYRYRTGEFGAVGIASATEHGFEAGFNHNRILSASRQAHFGFNFGLAATDALPSALATRGRLYRLLGDATLGYQFGRSWQARAAYRRGLEYIADLTEPVYVGGFSATVDGLLTRRVDFMASAGYSSGESALQALSSFDTYTASVRSRFALARSAAVYLEYLYYFYDFGGNSLLAPGLSPRLERHGVRAGLTLWAPAFRR